MESNDQQCQVPANSSRASNSSEEVVTHEDDSYRPNNQVLSSYHRIFPEGDRYVRVAHSPGFRFCPEDDELIVDFLNKEINKEQAEYIRIPKVNVYKHSPEELARYQQVMVKDEWYFFSPRDRKYANGTRPNRAAGNGYWKATGADKKICRDGVCVGFKKCLVFYEGPAQNGEKTDWIMHEYVSVQPPRERQGTDDMRLDDCVLCRIYKKSEQPPKTEKESTAAATECGETAKSAAHKSSKIKNQAAPKRVKPENPDANNLPGPQNVQQQQQQQMNPQLLQMMVEFLQVRQLNPLTPYQTNLPVQQQDPNPQMPHQNNFPVHPQMLHQINLTVQQPNPPTQHRYIQMRQPNPHEMRQQINLQAGQQPNPQEMRHQYLAVPHPNPPTMHQNPPVPHPNPLTMHQNLEAIPIQYDHNLGGVMQLDGHLGSASEDTGQAQADIVQNRHGTNFTDYTLRDMVRNLTPPQIYPNGFPFPPGTHDQGIFNSPSTDSFNPDSLLRNNDQDSDEP